MLVKNVTINVFSAKVLLQGFDHHGALEVFSTRGIAWKSLGTRNGNLCRQLGTSLVFHGGIVLGWKFWSVVLGGVWSLLLYMWVGVLHLRGSTVPWSGRVFWCWPFGGHPSQKNQTKRKENTWRHYILSNLTAMQIYNYSSNWFLHESRTADPQLFQSTGRCGVLRNVDWVDL